MIIDIIIPFILLGSEMKTNTFCKLKVSVMIKSYIQQKNGLFSQNHFFEGETLKEVSEGSPTPTQNP